MRGSMKNAESPEAYVAELMGWRKDLVNFLRLLVKEAPELEERIKWGHLVYFSGGPVCLIRAEEHRVLFGFWRGKRLRHLEPRLKPGGKYEMATLDLREGDTIEPQVVRALVTAAVASNSELGDPTDLSASS